MNIAIINSILADVNDQQFWAPAPAPAAEPHRGWLESLIHQLPHQGDLLGRCQQMTPEMAVLLVLLGMVYLLFGFKIFKALVMLNASVVGAWIGMSLEGGRGEAAIACGLIGAVVAAAIAWPTMKYAVALMGGIFGALLGASIWHTAELDPQLVWAGAMVGLIGFGLLSFILFNGSVMMYTSLQGAFMMVFGILGLVYKYHEIGPKVTMHLQLEPFLLPASVFVPAVIGLIYQQHHATQPNKAGGGGKK
jgi:hypothetical protein